MLPLSKDNINIEFMFIAPSRSIKKVFIHCSDSDNPLHDNIETIKQWHLQRGFKDIGYHFVITQNGMIHQGRNIEETPAAQQGYNTGSIAICLTGGKKFTEQQFISLKKMCQEINNTYKGSITFHGHCEVNKNKTCPNFNYKQVLTLDSNGYISTTHESNNNKIKSPFNILDDEITENSSGIDVCSMSMNDVVDFVSKVAPTIAKVVTNPVGGSIEILCELLNVNKKDDVKSKLYGMSIDEITAIDGKLKAQLEMRKIALEEKKVELQNNIAVIEDKNKARSFFANNKEILRFGMIMTLCGFLTIVFFAYQSLTVGDENLHFIREVKAFIEGSMLSLVMQYFFGSAHRSLD